MFIYIPCRCKGDHRTSDGTCPYSASHILAFENGDQVVVCGECSDYWELDHGHQIVRNEHINERARDRCPCDSGHPERCPDVGAEMRDQS